MKEKGLNRNYALHDHAYQKRRSEGSPGWDSAEVIKQSIREMEALLQFIKLPQQATVLDLGCGAGNLSFWLENKGYRVFGTDVYQAAIDWANELILSNMKCRVLRRKPQTSLW